MAVGGNGRVVRLRLQQPEHSNIGPGQRQQADQENCNCDILRMLPTTRGAIQTEPMQVYRCAIPGVKRPDATTGCAHAALWFDLLFVL